MYKIWIKARNQEKMSLHHIKTSHQLTIKSLNLKVDDDRRGKWTIYGPKHHKENQLLSYEHLVDYP